MLRTERATGSKPDMTPMMDIVFILIIFFVVTASFVKERGMQVSRPEAGIIPPGPQLQEDLMLELVPGYKIRHEGRLIDVWAATALMKRCTLQRSAAPGCWGWIRTWVRWRRASSRTWWCWTAIPWTTSATRTPSTR